MRRLGTRLGAAATSIYWHVASKDELVELVVDAVYGEVEVPAAADGAAWREAVAGLAHSIRSMIPRHPRIASLLPQVGLAYLGPNQMRMAVLFEAAGFTGREVRQAWYTVIAYVLGVATSEAAWLTTLARAGGSEQAWVARLYPAARRPRSPPAAARAVRAPARPGPGAGP
jgi:AcrR family transcriptional regulator